MSSPVTQHASFCPTLLLSFGVFIDINRQMIILEKRKNDFVAGTIPVFTTFDRFVSPRHNSYDNGKPKLSYTPHT